MKTKTALLAAVAVIGLSARGAEFYADFGEVVGKVRPELHGSGIGGQLVGGISGREPELLGPLGLWGARTHDWALINPGQRICDTHFVFPLMHLDPADPANYFFGPTDEILDRTVNLLGQNVLYRMGTSIESVNSRRKGGANPRYYNSVEPEDWEKYVGALEGIRIWRGQTPRNPCFSGHRRGLSPRVSCFSGHRRGLSPRVSVTVLTCNAPDGK